MAFIDGLRIDRALRLVLKATPKWTVFTIFLLAIQSIIPLVTIYIFKLVVDRLTLVENIAALEKDFEGLAILLAIALGLAILSNLCNALLGYANDIQSHLVADYMQHLVQAKSIDMDLAYYEHPQYYDKLHRAQREAPTRPLRIISGLTTLALNALTMLGAFTLLLFFNWVLVLSVFFASIPVLIYRIKYAEALYQLHREKAASERLSSYFNQVVTTVENAKEVRIFGFGPLMMNRFSEIRLIIRARLRQISVRGYYKQFITESTAALVGYGALAFIAYSAAQKTITLGETVMYFGAFQVAISSLRPTLSELAELYQNNLFLSTLYEFLDVPKTIPEPSNPKEIPRPYQSGLRVENVSFRYPGTNQLILKGVEMAIQPGEIIALVGRNGSGKTTLTKLLCRLYDPDMGQITIDGLDMRDFRIEDLRREISVVYQDFGRYHMTARENILLARPELQPDNPAIIKAAQWAGIHDKLIELPDGYDTVLSRTFTDGAELSIGQWQKLALARAFVRDSQLILLDEPTSALDAASEFEFFEKFREMARGRSALIISHRFSTVRLADRIYVLDGGRLIEQGNHEELIALDGLYAHLFHQQSSYYQEESSVTGDIKEFYS
ncbi:MAG: ABC transporter ATP-binding protein [Candidatus Competibacteraceae bacterium]|nr:ABC transporter ATP-binding protein [Candidatus Competibacteraceae bacterium]